jgi:hypothetical protein
MSKSIGDDGFTGQETSARCAPFSRFFVPKGRRSALESQLVTGVTGSHAVHDDLIQEVEAPLGRRPTREQAELVSQLAQIYVGHGVLEGTRTPPLHEHCPKCKRCWHGAGADPPVPARLRPRAKQAGVALPWVGRGFPASRLVVAGINTPVPKDAGDFGGLLSQWWIYSDLPKQMGDKKQYKGRSEFAYAAGTYILTIEAALKGKAINTSPAPGDAAAAWERCSLVELVKCSPVGGGSPPKDEMWSNCLGEYLVEELDVLKPRALIVMGISTAALRVRLLDEWGRPERPGRWTEEPGLKRGRLTIEGHSFPVFCCIHSRGNWRSSVAPLAESVEGIGLQ